MTPARWVLASPAMTAQRGSDTGDRVAEAVGPAGEAVEGAETRVDAVLAHLVGLYQLIDCDPALADTAAFCVAYGYPPEDSANTIIVAAKEDPPRYVACVVLATTRLDVNRAVRKKMGARKVSFASAQETQALTGMSIGGVTAVGLPETLELWVDSAVMARPLIVLGGGSRRRKIVAAPSLLLELAGAEVVERLAVAAPQAPLAGGDPAEGTS